MSVPQHVQTVPETVVAREMEKPLTEKIAFEIDTENADKRFAQAESLLHRSIVGLNESLKTNPNDEMLKSELKLANENLDTLRKARSQAAIGVASQVVSPKSPTTESVGVIKINESKGDEKKMSEAKVAEANVTPKANAKYLTPDPSDNMPQAKPAPATAGDSNKPTGVEASAPAATVENVAVESPKPPVDVKPDEVKAATDTVSQGGASPAPAPKDVPVAFPGGSVPIKAAAPEASATEKKSPPEPEKKDPMEAKKPMPPDEKKADEVVSPAPPAEGPAVEMAAPSNAIAPVDIMGTNSMTGRQESRLSSIRRVVTHEGIMAGKLPVAASAPQLNESLTRPVVQETRVQPRQVIRTPSMYQEHAMPQPMISDILGHKQDSIINRAREIMEQYGMDKEKAKSGWLVMAREILEQSQRVRT